MNIAHADYVGIVYVSKSLLLSICPFQNRLYFYRLCQFNRNIHCLLNVGRITSCGITYLHVVCETLSFVMGVHIGWGITYILIKSDMGYFWLSQVFACGSLFHFSTESSIPRCSNS